MADSVDELQDIVYSKTFKAPSAWADRERKYKMEKLDWETKAARQNVSLTGFPQPRLCLRMAVAVSEVCCCPLHLKAVECSSIYLWVWYALPVQTACK